MDYIGRSLDYSTPRSETRASRGPRIRSGFRQQAQTINPANQNLVCHHPGLRKKRRNPASQSCWKKSQLLRCPKTQDRVKKRLRSPLSSMYPLNAVNNPLAKPIGFIAPGNSRASLDGYFDLCTPMRYPNFCASSHPKTQLVLSKSTTEKGIEISFSLSSRNLRCPSCDPARVQFTVMVRDFLITVSVAAVTQACTTKLCEPEAMFRLVLMVEPFAGP